MNGPLALSFGAPTLLGWMALAGVPILIHLLHRQRHKTMEWAAMRWLMAALKKNQRWIRLEQWLLLAVRTALIALVVLAMMKPALEQAKGLFAVLGPSTHHILVIDNSLSMQYAEGNLTRFERAQEMATSILDSARQGDLASVLVLGSSVQVLVAEPSPYLASVAEEIENLTPEDASTRIEQMIEPLRRLVGQSTTSRTRVYLITDMQRSTWLGEGASNDPTELRRRLVELAGDAPISILDTSGQESPNLAVTQWQAIDPVAVDGRPYAIRATATNFGQTDRSDVRVDLKVDGEVEASEMISLSAGQSKNVTFAPSLTGEGDHTLEVQITGDPLPRDNSRYAIARVRPSLQVLLIDGQPSGESFRSETDYLRVALAPASSNGNDATGLIRVDVARESDLLEKNLDDFDVVGLINVRQITDAEAKAVASFVRRGGGFLLVAGNQLEVDSYNRLLGSQGEKILPVVLGDGVGEGIPSGSAFQFDPIDYVHPLVADFRDNEQAGLVSTKIYRYLKATIPASTTENESLPAPEIALKYSSGDPAIIVAPSKGGTVAILTTSADLDWNGWAISPSYLPVMQQLIRVLSAGKLRRPDVRAGETFTLSLPEGTSEGEISVERPSRAETAAEQNITAIKPERTDGVTRLTFSSTDRVGIYSCQLGPPADETWKVPVNTWSAESDLSKISEDELAGTFAGWKFRLLDRFEPDRPMGDVSASGSESIHRGLLYLVLALALVEPILAWRFSRSH
ncbi:BatA domain-containing protein [bacterium]|nr:BatA domain-containing protein [bacterium]